MTHRPPIESQNASRTDGESFEAARPQALTCDQVRSIDRLAMERFGIPGILLMENAGRGIAEVLDRLAPPGLVVILGGLGNNGGDGWVLARHWEILRGQRPKLVVVAAPHQEIDRSMAADARANWEILKRGGYPAERVMTGDEPWLVDSLESAAVIVDGLVGTGSRGPLRFPMDRVVEHANAASAMRVAIDIPSGLDGDRGVASQPCFRAGHTITMVAPKVGFELVDGPAFVGQVHTVGIGLPPSWRLAP